VVGTVETVDTVTTGGSAGGSPGNDAPLRYTSEPDFTVTGIGESSLHPRKAATPLTAKAITPSRVQ
jgi:hypothetical protein